MKNFRVMFFVSVFIVVIISYAYGFGKQISEKIVLKKTVLLTDRKILLGDICNLVNRQETDRKIISDWSLKNLEIGKLKPMETVVISRANITRKLKRVGLLIPISGAERIRVIRRGEIWTTSDLKKNIRIWLLSTLKTSEENLHIQFLSRLRQLTLPINVEIRKELPQNIKPYGLQSVQLTFIDNGVKFLSRGVSIRIDRKVEGFILSSDMAKGDILKMSSFQKTQIFGSKISRTEILDPMPYIGWKLKNHLKKGSFIKASYLKKKYMVKRGNVVSMIAKNFGISIHAKGYAKKNGVKNDIIPIQNISSGKVVFGKVVNINTVSIEF